MIAVEKLSGMVVDEAGPVRATVSPDD